MMERSSLQGCHAGLPGQFPSSSVLLLWKTRLVTPLYHRNCWHLLLMPDANMDFLFCCSTSQPAAYSTVRTRFKTHLRPVCPSLFRHQHLCPSCGQPQVQPTLDLLIEWQYRAALKGCCCLVNCCHLLLESTAACATTWPCWGRPAAGSTSQAAGPWVWMSRRMRARTRARETERMRAGTRHEADEVAPFSGCGQEPPRRRQGRAVLPTRDELLLPERVGQL